MSMASQFFGGGGGGSVPLGGTLASFSIYEDPLIDGPDGVYVRTGSVVKKVPDSTLSKIKSAGLGVNIPGSSVYLGELTTSSALGGIAYDNGKYVRVTQNGVLSSTDGTTWVPIFTVIPAVASTANGGVACSPIVYNSAFYIVTFGKPTETVNAAASIFETVIWKSTDALNWTKAHVVTGTSTNAPYAIICVANSRFFLILSSATNTTFYSTTDFITWLTPENGSAWTSQPSTIAFGLSTYVCSATTTGGNIVTSSNGRTWTQLNIGAIFYEVKFLNGLFIAVSDSGAVYTSTAPTTTWTSRATGLTPDRITCVAYGLGLYVVGSSTGKIATSPDGTTWTTRTSPLTKTVSSLVFANNTFVMLANDQAAYSTNGTTWTTMTIGYNDSHGTVPTNLNRYNNLLHDGTAWWAVDAYGSISKSTTLPTWTKILGTGLLSSTVGRFNGVRLINGNYFTMPTSGGLMASSTSNLGFKLVLNSARLNDIVYGNGIYVAVGLNCIWTSTDLITWTQRSSATEFFCVEYGNGKYIAGANLNRYSSTDAITWTSSVSGTSIQQIEYAGSLWVANGTSSIAEVSHDGVTWRQISGFTNGVVTDLGDVCLLMNTSNSTRWVLTEAGQVETNGGICVGYSSAYNAYFSGNSGLNALTTYYGKGQLAINAGDSTTNYSSYTAIGGRFAIPNPTSAAGTIINEMAGSKSLHLVGDSSVNLISINGGAFVQAPGLTTPQITPLSTLNYSLDYVLGQSVTTNLAFIAKRDTVFSGIPLLYAGQGPSPVTGMPVYRRVA